MGADDENLAPDVERATREYKPGPGSPTCGNFIFEFNFSISYFHSNFDLTNIIGGLG